MVCPKCKHAETQVIDTRDSNEGIRRRRECLACKQRFTTYERGEPVTISVLKKDGNRERFNPEKIRKGVSVACKNRPVCPEDIDGLVDHVEQLVSFSGQESITTQEIGRYVEDRLKQLDEVAYVRFVSVYQSFTDIEQFSDTIKSLG